MAADDLIPALPGSSADDLRIDLWRHRTDWGVEVDGAGAITCLSRRKRAMQTLRVVCYLNQFFGQLGGEDKAGVGPQVMPGAVGSARAVQQALGDARDCGGHGALRR